MALSLGSSLATKIYLGATEINLAYFGATQIYSAGGAFSAEAQSYFDRLDTAGDTTYVDYKLPLANYIDGLVTLGGAYWDTMESAACFVGVGIQGVEVPLRSGMPTLTNNNFLVGDLDQLTGLIGNGIDKDISTGVAESQLGQNDSSFSVYASTKETTTARMIGSGARNYIAGKSTGYYANVNDSSFPVLGTGTAVPNFVGVSRSSATEIIWLGYGQSGTTLETSTWTPSTGVFTVFSQASSTYSTARLATYHVGPAINLATLGALQDTLITEVAEAKFSTEAANYFARLAVAGDTTHHTYRQPLANYIDGLVALGGAYWDDMVSSCSYVGVGIQGITVPLRDGMTVPTNNNFVAADLNQLTGLVGDGSTKWMHTNTIDSDVLQDDASLSCWVSDIGTQTTARFLGSSDLRFDTNSPNTSGLRMWSQSTTRDIPTGFTTSNFAGINRSTGTGYNYLVNGTSGAFTRASLAPAGQPVSVFSSSTFNKSDVRLTTYHFGPALDLATLEGLQDTLITEIAAI